MKEVKEGFKVLTPKKQRGGHYTQSLQPKLVLFSWAKAVDENTVEQLFKMVMCRDYLGDVLWVEEHERELSIYGFHWTPADPKLDKDKTRLLIQTQQETDFALIFRNLDILHNIEKKNKWNLTRLVPSKDNFILVEGDINWSSSIPLISLYSYLIKVCTFEYKDTSDWLKELPKMKFERSMNGTPLEVEYAMSWTGLDKILDHLDIFCDDKLTVTGRPREDPKIENYTIHGSSGIGSLLTRSEAPYHKNNEYARRIEAVLEKKKK